MSNTFKAGDKVTMTPRKDEPLAQVLSSIAEQFGEGQVEFALDTVGLATHNSLEEHLKQPSAEPACVAFHLKNGKEIEMHYQDVTLVEQ